MDPSLPVAPESRRQLQLAPQKPIDLVLDKALFAKGLEVKTCPQCGANPAAGRTRTFQWVSPWIYLSFLLSLIVLLVLYYATRVTVTAWLPLCPDCQKADNRARNLLGLSFAGVLLGPIGFAIVGSAFDAGGIMACVGFVAGLVGAITAQTKLAPQIVSCRKIDNGAGTIKLRVAPMWRTVLEREQPEALRG